jgi:hypothetical protein
MGRIHHRADLRAGICAVLGAAGGMAFRALAENKKKDPARRIILMFHFLLCL